MGKLENKIVEKVYRHETRKTIFEIIWKTLLIFVSLLFGLLFAQALIRQLIYQQTFDVLEIFNEDIEIIQEHSGDIFETLIQEIPWDIVVYLAVFIIVFLISLLIFIKNFEIIGNKVRSIVKFRRNKWQE